MYLPTVVVHLLSLPEAAPCMLYVIKGVLDIGAACAAVALRSGPARLVHVPVRPVPLSSASPICAERQKERTACPGRPPPGKVTPQ
jgi:hypothetical protein